MCCRLMNIFSWSGLVDMNHIISDLFKVPNIQTGRMEPIISALTKEEEEMFRNMMRRLHQIAKFARERDVRVLIDAEQTYFQPAINRITMELMRKYNKDKNIIFNTYQCYLKDSYHNLLLDLELARRQNFYFGAKLVRGAYMEQERLRAQSVGYEDPINPTYEATTEMYHRCLSEIFRQIVEHQIDGRTAIMVASHNENTVRYTVNKMQELGIRPEHRVVCFGQLLGMCDQVSFLLGQAGYSVYKYVPYGKVNEVLPYLTRRAQENHGLLTKVDRECSLLGRELSRRIKSGELMHKPQEMVTRMRWKRVTFKITLLVVRSASVSMKLPLVTVSSCELRFVIRFSRRKMKTAVKIHRNLVSVYGEVCISIQMVRRWRSWFLEGWQNVHDDERSGRPVTATDNAAVRNVVEADRRITIYEIMIRLPPGIKIRRSSIRTIMSDVLNFHKVCARWVPRLLSENHKQQWMEAARAFLEMHRRDREQLFSCIVTGDESWVHHSTPETKRQNMVWKKPEESAPKKAKVTISAGKVMAIIFWDCKSVLLVDYLPPNTTINAARYCEVINKLRAAIKRKRPGLLSRKVLLLLDNARPHAARTIQTLLENFKWEIFTHPPYSPDLAPSDFHLFPALKLHLGGKHFANDDEVQAEANHWLRRQDTAWYNSGIKKLIQRYQKCLDRNGDYLEKASPICFHRRLKTSSPVVEAQTAVKTSSNSEQTPQRDPLDLTFENTKAAFKSKTTSELIRALVVLRLCSFRFLIDNNEKLIKLGRKVLGQSLFQHVMKKSFYGQFVAGEDIHQIKGTIDRLYSFGVKSILDYSAEEDISEEQAKETVM
ncbi:PRODH, partial [Cordylochernes scorpioides]